MKVWVHLAILLRYCLNSSYPRAGLSQRMIATQGLAGTHDSNRTIGEFRDSKCLCSCNSLFAERVGRNG